MTDLNELFKLSQDTSEDSPIVAGLRWYVNYARSQDPTPEDLNRIIDYLLTIVAKCESDYLGLQKQLVDLADKITQQFPR